jgi:hypothetical protein
MKALHKEDSFAIWCPLEYVGKLAFESVSDICALLAVRVCQLELLVDESEVEQLTAPLEQPAYYSLFGKQLTLGALFPLEDEKKYLQLAAAGDTLQRSLEAVFGEPRHES